MLLCDIYSEVFYLMT